MMLTNYEGYRVSIVGGCQSSGLAAWMRLFLPGESVKSWHVNSSPETAPDVVAPQIIGSDLVVTQFSRDMGGGAVEFDRLQEQFNNVVFLPVIVFGGFHPDVVSCGTKSEPLSFIRGRLDILQSSIALASYFLGLKVDRVPLLYNALTFEALGHVGGFVNQKTAFIDVFAQEGYNLEQCFDDWMRGSCFMYTDNHPKIHVLEHFARSIVGKAGLEAAELAQSDVVRDDLASSIAWPVYPALARRIGIEGSNSFVRAAHGIPAGESREIALKAFVQESYLLFDQVGIDNLNRVARVVEEMEILQGVLS